MKRPPPSGTVTFLFTDIVDSTVLWDRFPKAMGAALVRHDELVLREIAERNGFVFSEGGDGFGAAFATAPDALAAACLAQRHLSSESWPVNAELQVRMGVHTGSAEERDGNYFGSAVNRAARVSAAANGGQVLVSSSTAALVADGEWKLVDVGEHRLRGLDRVERLYRVCVEGVPDVDLPVRAFSEVVGNLPRWRVSS